MEEKERLLLARPMSETEVQLVSWVKRMTLFHKLVRVLLDFPVSWHCNTTTLWHCNTMTLTLRKIWKYFSINQFFSVSQCQCHSVTTLWQHDTNSCIEKKGFKFSWCHSVSVVVSQCHSTLLECLHIPVFFHNLCIIWDECYKRIIIGGNFLTSPYIITSLLGTEH